jgi:hypothetical protein
MSAMQRTGFEHNKETCTTICKTTCLSATNDEEIDICFGMKIEVFAA